MTAVEKYRKGEERWREIRKRGKWHFVLIRGGVGWGIPLGIIWNLAQLLSANQREGRLIEVIFKGAFMLIGFFLGGCLWAAYDWNRREK